MREGRWDAVDRENVAEEIESLGRAQFDKLVDTLRDLLLHFLIWDHQPQRRTGSSIVSIKERRIELEQILADNPGLRPRVEEAVARAYRRARLRAVDETDLDPQRFAETCPYSSNDIVSRDFSA